MKKQLVSLIVFLMFGIVASAQIQTCPFGAAFESQIQADSVYMNRVKARFQFLHNPYGNQNTTQSVGQLVIPVVVHVIHLNTESVGQGLNIPYAQIQSQIDRLNADYANNTGWAQNTGIQFCLAKNPLGPTSWTNPSEPGVMRYAVSSTSTNIYNQIYDYNNQSTVTAMLALTHPSANFFPYDRVLNIWTVNQITDGASVQFGGYSPEPLLNAAFPLDGIVIDAHMFGDNTVNNNNFPIINPQYNTGNICAHECGHYLSLFHTFTGGCAGMTNADCATNGDFICDTPPNTNTTASCNSTATCNENISPWGNRPDMIENFMTWADDNCLNTFTAEQGLVMRNYLQFMRSGLVQDTNLALLGVAGPGGCIPAILSAEFISPLNICINQTVAFQGYSGPGFTNDLFQWSFANAIPSSSNLQNPSVTFTASGAQVVTLTVTDTVNNSTATHSFSVFVSPCSSLESYMGNWYFGKRAGVSFATGTGVTDNAAFLNNTIRTYECGVSVSDTNGVLIFYSDGDSIWDRNHQLAVSNLIPNNSDSKSQIIYAPHPLHPNWYYLFHSPSYEQGPNPMRYSLIADSLGTIIPVHLNDSVPRLPGMGNVAGYGEHITAIPHCNGRDTWIITTGRTSTTNSFYYGQCLYVLLVSPAGVTNPDGVSPYPAVYWMQNSNIQYYYDPWGEMKASFDGTKIAFTGTNGAYIVDFDPSTGTISNDRHITGSTGWKYGLSFSPDGNSLYISDQSTYTIEGADLTAINPNFTIVATGNAVRGGLQLGPDGTIYSIHDLVSGVTLDRLNNPNNLSNPGYVASAVTVNDTYGVIRTGMGLPNFIEANRPAASPLLFTTSFTNCSTVSFNFPGCWHDGYHFHWNFGDNTTDTLRNPIHTYSASGTYTVTLTVSIGSFSYTITQPVTIINTAPQISGPTTICSGNLAQVQYVLPTGLTSYLWTVTGGGNIIGPNNNNIADVAWSGNGTINCVVSNGPNCQYNVSLPVTFYQSPIVNAGPDTIVSCLNSTVILGGSPSALGGQAPYTYQWLPAAQLNSYSVSNPMCLLQTSTTYTLNVTDAHGCASSDIITVLVDSSISVPSVGFNVGQQICDFTTSVSLQNYAYPSGGVFNGPGVSNGVFSPSAAGGPGNYLISYTITGGNGCTAIAIDTIHVIECCQATSGITTYDQQASAQYGSQFNSFPVPVRVNGTFFINNFFTITNYTGANSVRFSPNAEIIIKSGARLRIEANSVLEACSGGMWKGITIEPGGQLEILTGGTVKDAEQAISSVGGGNYILDQAILQNNYQNVILLPFTGQGLHPGTMKKSMVLGSPSLTLTPHVGTKTYSGVEVTDVDSVYLGFATSPSDMNVFRTMDFGLISIRSTVYVWNNSFNSIVANGLPPATPACCITNSCQNSMVCYPPQKGSVIWAFGGSVKVGGPTTAYANIFYGSTRGVLSNFTKDVVVQNNQFQSIYPPNSQYSSMCVLVQNCDSSNAVLSDNIITSCKNGIGFGHSTASNVSITHNRIDNLSGTGINVLQTNVCPIHIYGNEINTDVTYTSTAVCAIRVANAVISNTTRYIEVKANVSKQCQKGIWATNAQYIVIDSTNTTSFPDGVPATAYFGIVVQNSANALVDGNQVWKDLPIPTNSSYPTRLYGISMETNCFNTQVSNNSLTRLGSGLQYFNVNNAPSTISCNTFTSDYRGVVLNSTYVGNQGLPISTQNPYGIDQDNLWYIPTSQTNVFKAVYGINSTTGSLWYYRSSGVYGPLPTQLNPTNIVSFTGPQPNAPSLCATGGGNGNPDIAKQSDLADIASRTGVYDSLDYATLFVMDQSVYEQIKQDSSLLTMGTSNDSILSAFYADKQGDNVGLVDEAYSKATEGDMAAAETAKSSIDPRGNPDLNHKTLLDIYLRTWAIGVLEFSPEDSATLYNIAIQNVTYGGTAVYDARVMLDLDIDDTGDGAAQRLTGNNTNNESNSDELYPNPTNGLVTYETNLADGDNGYIVVIDIFGRQLISQPVSHENNKVQMDLSTLPSGVYMYRVIINDETRQTGKIILDK